MANLKKRVVGWWKCEFSAQIDGSGVTSMQRNLTAHSLNKVNDLQISLDFPGKLTILLKSK